MDYRMELHGLPHGSAWMTAWNCMGNRMELHGYAWNCMDMHGIAWMTAWNCMGNRMELLG